MVYDKCWRGALKQWATEERERLSKLHLITTTEELSEALSEIDYQTMNPKKSEKKRALIREQVNIRKSF